MNRRTFLKNTMATAAVNSFLIIQGLASEPQKNNTKAVKNYDSPNIILIMTDQFRPDHLSRKFTPNLYKLANEGVKFTNAYAPAPLCQPARNSIITGLYPSQTKICGNQSDPIKENLRNDTFMHHLQNSGYYTAMIGKHHYIDRYGVGLDVTKEDEKEVKKYGFDHVTQCLDVYEHWWYNQDDYIYYLREKDLEKKYMENIKSGISKGVHPLSADDTEDGYIANKAVEFIEKYEKDKPLYLNVSFIGPHPPYTHPGKPTFKPMHTQEPLEAESTERLKEKRAHYANYCHHIDNYIGKLVDSLKQKGIYDDTVIIFTADHGDLLGDFGIWDKRYFYEQSVSVPLFMTGKAIQGGIRGNGPKESKALVSTIDLYPTILNIAGIKIPESERPGKNLMDILNNKSSAYREAVFSQLGTAAMIRTTRWKLVYDPEQGGICYLFNLVNDPGELKNLAGVAGYEEISAELTQHLLSYYIDLHQFTHIKEQQRLQKVRTMFTE